MAKKKRKAKKRKAKSAASKKKAAKKKSTKKRGSPWRSGQSGNPAGRKPDKELQKLREQGAKLFGEHAVEAVDTIVLLMRTANEKVSLLASQEILNRVYGKVPDQLNLGNADGDNFGSDQEAILGVLFGIAARGRAKKKSK